MRIVWRGVTFVPVEGQGEAPTDIFTLLNQANVSLGNLVVTIHSEGGITFNPAEKDPP